jgi:hypothetical protein
VLPWGHVSAGLHDDFLWQEWTDALAAATPTPTATADHQHLTEDCRWTPCYDCGACTGLGLEHVVASPVAPAGGSQGTNQDLDAPVTFLPSAPAPAGAPA